MTDINELSEQAQVEIVSENPERIMKIKNPTERVQFAAIASDPETIFYIKNPSENLQYYAVQKQSSAIEYISNPTEKVQEYILKHDPIWLTIIEKPSKTVFERYKSTVVKILLEILMDKYRDNGLPYYTSEDVPEAIYRLHAAGITWREFSIINNSIEADKKLKQ